MKSILKSLTCFSLIGVVFCSCQDKKDENLNPLENIVVGKTDYPGCYYEDYEPDLVITTDIDLSDTINNQNNNGYSYASNGGLDLYKYNDYTNDILIKYLSVSTVGNETVARMNNNDTLTRIFEYGDTLGVNCNWVDESFCCYTDFAAMSYNYESDIIIHSYNANLTHKYAGFRNTYDNGYPVYCWIHFSLINLDTLIIHEAFTTPFIELYDN